MVRCMSFQYSGLQINTATKSKKRRDVLFPLKDLQLLGQDTFLLIGRQVCTGEMVEDHLTFLETVFEIACHGCQLLVVDPACLGLVENVQQLCEE